ncbi:MAG: type III-A CRISPR-associated protein Csm2 [Bryobacteraceae bacterium]|nr:type III-A CRISPR-associated protein Csm2 [Bryobacteraceae bacterium]
MPAPNQPTGRPPQAAAQGQAAGGHALPPVKYFNEHGKLRPELLDSEAQEVGEALAKAGLESAQLRRFYGDVLSLRRRFEIRAAGAPFAERDSIFEDILPEFRMLRAKAFYANKRSDKILPAVMKEFIQRHVQAVKTWQDFQAFCRHFEAVVAFHYAFSKK